MAKQVSAKTKLRKAIQPLEASLLSQYYFSVQDYLKYEDKLKLLGKYILNQLPGTSVSTQPEITFFLYSKACERMLIPLLVNLLQRPEVKNNELKVNLIVLNGVHQLKLTPSNSQKLEALNCPIQTDYIKLIEACKHPENKLVVVCLDHRMMYEFHQCGVDTVDRLKTFGVKTLSIQHGGTRRDSVAGLATTVSDKFMVWGKRVERELIHQYSVDSSRVRLVGNPLHDRLAHLDSKQVRERLVARYPQVSEKLESRKIVSVATCLHTEYKGYENEQELYRKWIQLLYQGLDFDRVLLLVKMHPNDSKNPNLYRQAAEEISNSDSIIVIEPEITELDVYGILSISDLLLTRCSTVAEEALMMGKKVVAFDLFEDGPSKGYKHLEEYGSYRTAYASPDNALNNAISAALFSEEAVESSLNVAEDITYRLDGNSTNRAVDEILTEVLASHH
ncbi:MAG: UDP-N-acetylglucosamine 2-epimerase [Cyanobacteria bacterium SID2]|nr:UDP-N-acetylglucosamine 2-epimerase [Cyanobacteria bacterium SID2]MBP0005977.1 UDP-N-acetylglucosamine 2-epimerase [Cyanobacteria bacterium SBC]